MADFKPSDVALSIPPLVGVFGNAEAEHAAAVMVRGLQGTTNSFRPISFVDARYVIERDVEAKRKPFALLMPNPFFNPNIDKLIHLGFARFVEGRRVVEFTAEGVSALQAFVARTSEPEEVTHG